MRFIMLILCSTKRRFLEHSAYISKGNEKTQRNTESILSKMLSVFYFHLFHSTIDIINELWKKLLVSNIWDIMAFLGLTLDRVCGTCACIYTSGASPMTLSPRDAANKKPYVFSLSGAQIVAQGIVSVNVGREKTGSQTTE